MTDETKALLRDCRNYLVDKAGRHDLNWRDANAITDRIDAALSNESVAQASPSVASAVYAEPVAAPTEFAAQPTYSEGTAQASQPAVSASHPEDYCEKCGGKNFTWFAPSPLWNKYASQHGIICPQCWKLEPEFYESADQQAAPSDRDKANELANDSAVDTPAVSAPPTAHLKTYEKEPIARAEERRNAEILERAASTRDEFYKEQFDVMKEMSARPASQQPTPSHAYVNRCAHEWYYGHCVHCNIEAVNGRPKYDYRAR